VAGRSKIANNAAARSKDSESPIEMPTGPVAATSMFRDGSRRAVQVLTSCAALSAD
jgi:hypothetical protein